MAGAFIFWFFCALIGAVIGSKKNKPAAGFFLGLLLGPIGCAIVALMKGDMVNCPNCYSLISDVATVCPKCGREVTQGGKQEKRRDLRGR